MVVYCTCTPVYKTYKEKALFGKRNLIYERYLESTKHGTITPQCVDKMLSKNTFLETRSQPLHDDLFILEKVLGVHVHRMFELSRCLYTGGYLLGQNVRGK